MRKTVKNIEYLVANSSTTERSSQQFRFLGWNSVFISISNWQFTFRKKSDLRTIYFIATCFYLACWIDHSCWLSIAKRTVPSEILSFCFQQFFSLWDMIFPELLFVADLSVAERTDFESAFAQLKTVDTSRVVESMRKPPKVKLFLKRRFLPADVEMWDVFVWKKRLTVSQSKNQYINTCLLPKVACGNHSLQTPTQNWHRSHVNTSTSTRRPTNTSTKNYSNTCCISTYPRCDTYPSYSIIYFRR